MLYRKNSLGCPMTTDRSTEGIILDDDMLTFTPADFPVEDEVKEADSKKTVSKSTDLGEFNFEKPSEP